MLLGLWAGLLAGEGTEVSKATASASNGGIGFGGALTLLFVALKLLRQIDWSWWWVLAPVWAPLALVGAVGVFCLFVALLQWAFGLGEWRTRRP